MPGWRPRRARDLPVPWGKSGRAAYNRYPRHAALLEPERCRWFRPPVSARSGSGGEKCARVDYERPVLGTAARGTGRLEVPAGDRRDGVPTLCGSHEELRSVRKPAGFGRWRTSPDGHLVRHPAPKSGPIHLFFLACLLTPAGMCPQKCPHDAPARRRFRPNRMAPCSGDLHP